MEQNVNRTANHCTGRIPLEGLPNTRDLGGIRTMEGKKILPARLIRSGALYEATPADLERLMGEWRLWREARNRIRTWTASPIFLIRF